MKTLSTAFCNFMDRIGESDHFLRCGWIFMCVTINAAIGALIGKGIGELLRLAVPSPTIVHTSVLYSMAGMGGIVLLLMLANYRNLWELSGPSLTPAAQTPSQSENKATVRLHVRDVPLPVE